MLIYIEDPYPIPAVEVVDLRGPGGGVLNEQPAVPDHETALPTLHKGIFRVAPILFCSAEIGEIYFPPPYGEGPPIQARAFRRPEGLLRPGHVLTRGPDTGRYAIPCGRPSRTGPPHVLACSSRSAGVRLNFKGSATVRVCLPVRRLAPPSLSPLG